jgi:transketolase
VALALAETAPAPMEFVDLGDRYAESGKPEHLLEKYGMTAQNILAAVDRVLKRK